MRWVLTCWKILFVAALSLTWLSSLRAMDKGERPFCSPPATNCTDDRLEIAFPLMGASNIYVFEYAQFVSGTPVDVEVMLDTVSGDADTANGEGIQGWSYGVAHDAAILALDEASVTTAGTAVDDIFSEGFNVTRAVPGGFMSAVVLAFTENRELPTGRNSLCKASYELIADAGEAGTEIRFVSQEIGVPGSPPTDINLTINGSGFLPKTVMDGVVRKNPMPVEDCDNGIDDDGDGLIDLDDPDCQECPCDGECPDFALYFTNLSASNRIPAAGQVDARGRTGFAISSRNASRLLAVQFGARSTAAGGVTYQFAGDIGTDPERLVEILMVDAQGGNIAPETPNTIITDALAIQSIERGAAVASFAGGDYLEYDLDPGVGGPGFFVGYTSDMDDDANAIPITTDCDLNEILVVNIGGGAECPDNAFYFGGVATDGSVDARGETSFLITSRNAQALLAFSFGVSTTTEAGGVRYEFADDIGIDSDRLVEVLMTNIHGDEIFPATPNTLLASSGEVVAVERASDLAPFAGGDFLQWDGDPGVGGPGFFVGYVSDLDDDVSQIPATPPGDAGNCPLNELLIIRLEGGIVCPDYGLFFGDQPTAQTLDATGEPSAVVSCRNAEPLLAFQFGVSVTGAAGVYTYEFSGDLGTDSERLVEILMTEADGDSVTPQAVNKLQNDTDAVLAITRGAAVAPFAGGDFLEYDLDPGVGGPGFFVGYVSDMDDNVNVIPATAGEGCPLNEILVLHFAGVEQPFSRGDADVNGKVNISDAVWIIQILFGSFVEKVDCDDALDANDDGSLNIDDAMIVLAWMFQRGEALPPPFLTCGVDETPDGLDCRQSNCIVD